MAKFVFEYVKNRGAKVLSLGMIDEHTILKEWYKELGFREMSVKKFEHLPFTVCFMDYNI